MSKTPQENPAAENPATENVSNPSTEAAQTASEDNTVATVAPTTPKTSRSTRTNRSKSSATNTKTKATPNTTIETETTVTQDKNMSQNTIRRVAIIGGNRIPFARSNGAYFTASNIDMFTAALNGLVERYNLAGQRLGEVVAGAVLKHSRDFNMTRECVLNTALAPETPAY